MLSLLLFILRHIRICKYLIHFYEGDHRGSFFFPEGSIVVPSLSPPAIPPCLSPGPSGLGLGGGGGRVKGEGQRGGVIDNNVPFQPPS